MKSIFTKISHHVSSAPKASPAQVIHSFQIHPFSSSLKTLENPTNQHPFAVTYLIKACGLSPREAILASKRVNLESAEKPDSVLVFFKHNGFTKTHISNIVRMCPEVLLFDHDKTLTPKFEFLKSKGFSAEDIAKIASTSQLSRRSLENLIIPSFEFCCNFLQSEEKAVAAIKRCSVLISLDRRSHISPNIKILHKAGVPNARIMSSLLSRPRTFTVCSNKFEQIVGNVKRMGFDPLKEHFIRAVDVLRGVSKVKWKKKVAVYKKWGWTEGDILGAFKLCPHCMLVSEDKINQMMDFAINQLGWESSLIARRPALILFSLQKRIAVRFAIYQVLLSKGLIKTNGANLLTMLTGYSEKQFLEKFVVPHKEEVPELLKLYQKKLELAKQVRI